VSDRTPERVSLGRITKPHGLAGEVVVVGAPFSADEFAALRDLFGRDAKGGSRHLELSGVRPFLHSLLVRFAGVSDRDAAVELAGLVLEIDPARLPRPEPGQVYVFELLGLVVATDTGEELGRVHDVMQTGAAPILVVHGDPPTEGGKPRERLLPMSPDALVAVDVPAGRITLRMLPGMAEL
jgi:16S rRNA processing protein RimM